MKVGLLMDAGLQDSYRHCRRVARQSSSSFYWTFRLLPARQRRAMCALYAFSRHTDDLGDSSLAPEIRRRHLESWRDRVSVALGADPDSNAQLDSGDPDSNAPDSGDQTLPALVDTVVRYDIPREHLLDIIRGVMMDIEPREFETIGDLQVYCYRVASCVGLACLHIWGFRDPAVRAPAVACGQAFQMTNILRDLREDALRGRLYLPREDLKRFDVRLEDLRHGSFNHRVAALMQFEIERTERLYCESEATGEFLTPAGRRMFSMMFATYRELLCEIKRRGGDVFAQRVRLPLRRKVVIAARHTWPLAHGMPSRRDSSREAAPR